MATPHLEPTPECPRRADGVQLLGQLAGSGFSESQWLISRGASFLQVSELLYRVTASCDGTLTLGEIAALLTEETSWRVEEEHVRVLIEHKLAPLGLISTASAQRAPQLDVDALLRVGMRMKTLGPPVLDRVTAVLRWLYVPVLVLGALGAIAFAHVVLYTSDALSRGLVDLLLHPLLVIPLFAILLLGNLFHEFGHASAVRYGGGQARTIGVGFYLIYPAFYTDTSDAYRLTRWQRVRVDLGGPYFHLLFASAAIAVSFAAGWPILGIVALAVNIDVARQLLIPFVRLDGYWLLGDLMGIPDPFTYATALLGGRLSGRRTAPRLRSGPRRVLTTYLTLCIPALAFMLYLFAVHAPGYVELAWHSLGVHTRGISAAISSHRPLLAVAALLNLGILLLPVVGTIYGLSVLARTICRVAAAVRAHRADRAAPVRAVTVLLPSAQEIALDPPMATTLRTWFGQVHPRPSPSLTRLREVLDDEGEGPRQVTIDAEDVPVLFDVTYAGQALAGRDASALRALRCALFESMEQAADRTAAERPIGNATPSVMTT
jgi:putative peptide zinc metalloprotease protein